MIFLTGQIKSKWNWIRKNQNTWSSTSQKNYNLNTRLYLEGDVLQQVHEVKLLGLVVLREDLSWKSNTNFLIKRAYMRMIILRNIFQFDSDLLFVHSLSFRAISSCVAHWKSPKSCIKDYSWWTILQLLWSSWINWTRESEIKKKKIMSQFCEEMSQKWLHLWYVSRK